MLEKADFDFVRRQNRYLVLASLRREGPLARIELVRSTGLSTATITSITADLIAERLIVVASDGDELATRSPAGAADDQAGPQCDSGDRARHRDFGRPRPLRAGRLRRQHHRSAPVRHRRLRQRSQTLRPQPRGRRREVPGGSRFCVRPARPRRGIGSGDRQRQQRQYRLEPRTGDHQCTDLPSAGAAARRQGDARQRCQPDGAGPDLARSGGICRHHRGGVRRAWRRHGPRHQRRALWRADGRRRRVRPHEPHPRRTAVPLRPARLHRGLCRRLRHCPAGGRQRSARATIDHRDCRRADGRDRQARPGEAKRRRRRRSARLVSRSATALPAPLHSSTSRGF